MKNVKRYPENHFFNIGLAMGIPFSVIAGIAFGNMAYGPLTGITAGFLLGVVLERYYNPEPIEGNEESQLALKKYSGYGMVIGLVVFLVVVTIYFLKIH